MSQTDCCCPHFREAFLRDLRKDGEPSGFMDNFVKSRDDAFQTVGYTEDGKVREGSFAAFTVMIADHETKEEALRKKKEENAQKVVGFAAMLATGWNMWNNYKQQQEEEQQVTRKLEEMAKENGGKLLCDDKCKSLQEVGLPRFGFG